MERDMLPDLLKEVQNKFEASYGKSEVVRRAFEELKRRGRPMPQQMILLWRLETFWQRLSVRL